jgi:hypothetical protein
MSLPATRWGWTQCAITSTQKFVLLDLCDRANHQNVCWPKQKTIAQRTRYTERAVNSALRELEELGLISRQKRMIGTRRTSDLITLQMNRPAAGSSTVTPSPTPVPPDAPPLPLPHEPASDENLNVVPEPTGTTFSVIYQDEPSRQKQTMPLFLEVFPLPGRPDLEALTYAARTIEDLSSELGEAIDWPSPGIQNLQPIVRWLEDFDESKVTSCLIEVAQRNRDFRSPIRSWRYFEAEILRTCQIDQ